MKRSLHTEVVGLLISMNQDLKCYLFIQSLNDYDDN